jgi:hypothetical protein
VKHIVVVVVLVVGCDKSSSKEGGQLAGSKVDLARLQVRSFADTAYPQWAIKNPQQPCPDSLSELAQFASADAKTKDPWGNELAMYCGSSLPPGAKAFAVASAGPDGKRETADDVKSWE